jgi:hypothetical protein
MNRQWLLRAVGALSLGVLALRCSSSAPSMREGRQLADDFGLVLAPAPASGVSIRVVDDASGAAVADALVVAVDETRFWQIACLVEQPEDDAERRMRDLGVASLADADGTTRVALPERPTIVMAFHGNRFGRATIEARDPVERVVGIGARRLEVEVVDATGRPQAGVPVALDTRCNVIHEHGLVRESDASGRLVIEGHELERFVHQGCGRVAVVQLGFPSRPYALRAIDDARLEPVRIVAPSTSRLVVELRDLDDRPLTAPALLECQSQRPPGEERQSFWPDPGADRAIWRRNESGRIDLGPFEVGLVARLSVECQEFEFEPCTSVAPLAAGETRTVVMRAQRRVAATPPSPEADETVDAIPTVVEELPEPAGAIEASFVVADPTLLDHLSIELRPDRPDEEASTVPAAEQKLRDWPIRRGSRLIVRDVAPGRWRAALVVGDPDRTTALQEWDGLIVPEHGVLRDPRLQEIDLRGRLSLARIEVVDEEGRPLFGTIATESADGWCASWLFGDGLEDLVSVVPIRRVTLFAAGRRTVTLDPPATSQRIVLPRGRPVRVALPPGIGLPAGFALGVVLLAQREGEGVGATSGDSEYAVLDDDGTALLHVGGPGRYAASFWLLALGESGCVDSAGIVADSDTADRADDPITLDAAALEAGAVVTLPIDAKWLEEAVAAASGGDAPRQR